MVRTTDTLHESLAELARIEPAFAAVLEQHGNPEPRISPPAQPPSCALTSASR